MSSTEVVICTYRVKAGQEAAFEKLLERHWPTLRGLGLVTNEAPQHFRGFEESGEPFFVEIFTWASGDAAEKAHEHPDVMAVWEAMGALTESRAGRPSMEFPHVQPLALRLAA
jgi:hypothetical protein